MSFDFDQADGSKIQLIENAAMAEFAQKGYDLASTNNIVKTAGVSKGLLFHYFSSKAELYEYLLGRTMDLTVEFLYARIDYSEADLFRRINQIALLKMELFRKHPYLFDFMTRAYFSETNTDMKQKAADLQQERMADIEQNTLKNIDFSVFKEGLDIEKSLTVMMVTTEELMKKKSLGGKLDMNEVYEYMGGYLDYFKKLFYK